MPDAAYTSPYQDDTDLIPDACVLYRRVPPVFIDWGVLNNNGEPKIKSGAFQDFGAKRIAELGYPSAAMSVERSDVLNESETDPHDLLSGYGPAYGLAKFPARLARENQQGVNADPLPESAAHAIVFSKVSRKRTGAAMDALAAGATWEVVPKKPA